MRNPYGVLSDMAACVSRSAHTCTARGLTVRALSRRGAPVAEGLTCSWTVVASAPRIWVSINAASLGGDASLQLVALGGSPGDWTFASRAELQAAPSPLLIAAPSMRVLFRSGSG